MHSNTIESYKDISSRIISYSYSPRALSLSLCRRVCARMCACIHMNLTDLTQSLNSLETQWSHLISHASDALMNQHTLACQQLEVVVKYTGRYFSQTAI